MKRKISINEIANRIDHTLLKIDVNPDTLKKFVSEGIKYGVRGLVTTPTNIPLMLEYLGKNKINAIGVVSFPFGHTCIKTKIYEIDCIFEFGADEIDIVLNTSLVKFGKMEKFREEAETVSKYIKENYPNNVFKLICEITILDKDELNKVIEIINEVKPHYFKTSTGYGPRGTQPKDIRYIRRILNNEIKIKASGGIRNLEQFIKLIESGADIIGSSSGTNIVKEAINKFV